ncbi:hypothetical protein LXL04_030094 [Taraxacum kok-saghyz]
MHPITHPTTAACGSTRRSRGLCDAQYTGSSVAALSVTRDKAEEDGGSGTWLWKEERTRGNRRWWLFFPAATKHSDEGLTVAFWSREIQGRSKQSGEVKGESFRSYWTKLQKHEEKLRIFLWNSYIPENPRTPPILYISQTVIRLKKPTSGPFKTIIIIIIRSKFFPKKRYFYFNFYICATFFFFFFFFFCIRATFFCAFFFTTLKYLKFGGVLGLSGKN